MVRRFAKRTPGTPGRDALSQDCARRAYQRGAPAGTPLARRCLRLSRLLVEVPRGAMGYYAETWKRQEMLRMACTPRAPGYQIK